jgi:hypothetical protein
MRHLLSARGSHTRFSLTGGLLWTLPLIKRLLSKDRDRSIHIVRSTSRISRNTAISRHISCSVRSPLSRSISFPCSRARFSLVPFPLRSRGSVRARPSARRWIGPSRLWRMQGGARDCGIHGRGEPYQTKTKHQDLVAKFFQADPK